MKRGGNVGVTDLQVTGRGEGSLHGREGGLEGRKELRWQVKRFRGGRRGERGGGGGGGGGERTFLSLCYLIKGVFKCDEACMCE